MSRRHWTGTQSGWNARGMPTTREAMAQIREDREMRELAQLSDQQKALRLGEQLEDWLGEEEFARWFDEMVPVRLPWAELLAVYQAKKSEMYHTQEGLNKIFRLNTEGKGANP